MSEQEREGLTTDQERFETDEGDDVEAHSSTPSTTPAAERFSTDEGDDVEAHSVTPSNTP
jgi:hypothetical protein